MSLNDLVLPKACVRIEPQTTEVFGVQARTEPWLLGAPPQLQSMLATSGMQMIAEIIATRLSETSWTPALS